MGIHLGRSIVPPEDRQDHSGNISRHDYWVLPVIHTRHRCAISIVLFTITQKSENHEDQSVSQQTRLRDGVHPRKHTRPSLSRCIRQKSLYVKSC